nr:hypothetical protein [uncultured Dyadobacter sp.]
MKKHICFYLLLSLAIGCKDKETAPVPRFVPTDVIVKTKKDFTIDKVFGFINGYDHQVDYIYSTIYTSSLPPDSLQYVLDYLNRKSYTNRKDWPVGGYRHYLTDVIHIFPRLYDIKDKANQQDWLETIRVLKLKEVTDRDEFNGSIIYFHVPAGTELDWVKRYEKMNFVDWAQVNAYIDISPM